MEELASSSTKQPETKDPETKDPETKDPETLDPTSRPMSSGFKIPKPDKFDGSDTSLSTVTNWIYDVEEYMELAQIDKKDQTRCFE